MPRSTSVRNTRLLTTWTLISAAWFCLAREAFADEAASDDSRCKLSPELEEGPFYLNETLWRSDIAEDQPGVPLALVLKVVNADCQPLADAFVDIWTANSTGYYSGYTCMGQNGSRGPPHRPHPPHGPGKHRPHHHPVPTDDLTFLRGVVQTNETGIAEFTAIAPGWYAGRTPHIHIKVHVPYHTYTNVSQEYVDSHVVHTSQFFFPDSLYDELQQISPYKESRIHRTRNHEDHDYRQDPKSTLRIVKSDAWQKNGITGSITSIVDANATPGPVHPHMGPKKALPFLNNILSSSRVVSTLREWASKLWAML